MQSVMFCSIEIKIDAVLEHKMFACQLFYANPEDYDSAINN